MRTGVLVAGAVLVGAGVLWLARDGAPREGVRLEPGSPSTPLGTTPAPLAATPPAAREVGATAPDSFLRGRVVTEAGEPLPGASLTLAFLDELLAETESDLDGRFTLPAPPREGVELAGVGPDDWELTPASLELDRAPAEDIVFIARRAVVPTGLVRGRIVDDQTGEPLPFAAVAFDRESLVADAQGYFASCDEHERGVLEVDFESGWNIDIDFDPERGEPLVIPARVGPRLVVVPSLRPEGLGVAWIPGGVEANDGDIRRAGLRNAVPTFVQLPVLERGERAQGDLVFYAYPEFVAASVAIPDVGATLANPLPVELRPCGLVQWTLRHSREIDWYGEHPWVRLRSEGGQTSLLCSAAEYGQPGLSAVFESGEHTAEVWFEGELVTIRKIQARVGEAVIVKLDVELPEGSSTDQKVESAAPQVHPLRGRVLSLRNRPAPGQIRITSQADFDSEIVDLVWTKEQGRWSAMFELEAPAGPHDVNLELGPAFHFDGPAEVELPHEGELVYTLRDDVPLREVWLAPFDPETGAPIPAFEVELLGLTRDYHTLGGDDFHSASLPVVRQLPSDVPFFWRCTAAGRQAVGGLHEPDGATGPLRLTFPLPRGWGAFLYVGGPNGEPLEGADVFLDGRAAGRTDALGCLALAATDRPAQLDVRYRDWSLESGDLELDGSFDDSSTSMNVYLEPLSAKSEVTRSPGQR